MSARALLAFAASAAAGFVLARALLGREPPEGSLPAQLEGARSRLLAARDRAGEALAAARSERDAAASELTEEYVRRARPRPPA